MQGYITIAKQATAELLEKRSRFLSLALPVSCEDEANAALGELRSRYWDANHNCYAYILRSGGIQRYSDDGEPSGTAGMPILEVIRRKGLVDVMVVVTRYFGGTLLGAGGLVRAYSKSAALALDGAEILRMTPCTVFTLELPYHHYGKLAKILQGFLVAVLEDDFADVIHLTLRIPSDRLSAFEKELAELSAGGAAVKILREEFAPV